MTITVPPGQNPPFEVIDDQHHAGIIIITAAICLVISLVCLLIRVYVRLLLSPPFGVDDLILLGATIFAIVESVVVFYTASIGFGTAISLLGDRAVYAVQRSLVASDVLYLITLYLSKCCIIAIYLRLTPRLLHQIVLWGTFAISTIGVITSILIITVNCSLNHPWVTPAQHCSGLFARWQFIASLDVITEMCLFIFSLGLVYDLQMPFNHKSIILLSFAARIPLLVFQSFRLSHFRNYTTSTNPSFDAINHYVWTQIQLNYSLVSCTVFCLRPFMNAVSTSYGTAGDVNLDGSTPYTSDSYALRSLENNSPHNRLSKIDEDFHDQISGALFLPKDGGHGAGETVITSGDADGDVIRTESIGSEGSTRMIIKKNVEYTVRHELR